jgi:hypothetical protein
MGFSSSYTFNLTLEVCCILFQADSLTSHDGFIQGRRMRMYLNNVNKYASNQSNKALSRIKIEEADESWALKLLNDSEQEDRIITVHNQLADKQFRRNNVYVINENDHMTSSDQQSDEVSIEVKEKVEEAPTSSPSTIELQMIAWLFFKKLHN